MDDVQIGRLAGLRLRRIRKLVCVRGQLEASPLQRPSLRNDISPTRLGGLEVHVLPSTVPETAQQCRGIESDDLFSGCSLHLVTLDGYVSRQISNCQNEHACHHDRRSLEAWASSFGIPL